MKREHWDINNIGDQRGKVVVVTGSSSGIGYEAAKALADKNAEVTIAVRNQLKGDKAVEKIVQENANANVKIMILDLADLQSVKSFAEKFKKENQKLDILINNAGVMIPPYSKTKDGFELQFGTNHLGHFALTAQLFDLLKNTPGSRIVNVSSTAHNFGKLDFSDLNWQNRKYKPWRAYGDSKIANIYFTNKLSRLINDQGIDITVTAAHPGWTATDLQRHTGALEFLNRFFAMPAAQGALPTLRAAIDVDVQNGDYFGPGGFREMKGYPVKVASNDLSKDESIADKLWNISEEMTGIKFNGN